MLGGKSEGLRAFIVTDYFEFSGYLVLQQNILMFSASPTDAQDMMKAVEEANFPMFACQGSFR